MINSTTTYTAKVTTVPSEENFYLYNTTLKQAMAFGNCEAAWEGTVKVEVVNNDTGRIFATIAGDWEYTRH